MTFKIDTINLEDMDNIRLYSHARSTTMHGSPALLISKDVECVRNIDINLPIVISDASIHLMGILKEDILGCGIEDYAKLVKVYTHTRCGGAKAILVVGFCENCTCEVSDIPQLEFDTEDYEFFSSELEDEDGLTYQVQAHVFYNTPATLLNWEDLQHPADTVGLFEVYYDGELSLK